VEGSCEHGNEISGSINVGKLLSSCTTGGFPRRTHNSNFLHLDFFSDLDFILPETDFYVCSEHNNFGLIETYL
jgi:hypothetical protein